MPAQQEKKGKHHDWFDENDSEIQKLLDDKNSLHHKILASSGSYKASLVLLWKEKKHLLQKKLRQMKNRWWDNLSTDIQSAFDRNDSKNMYALMKQAFGPRQSSISPLLSKDKSTLLKNPAEILDRWTEHFSELFHNPSVDDDAIINNLPQKEIIYEMSDLPTKDEA